MKISITLIGLLFMCSLRAQQNMHITEQLLNSTVRIEAFNARRLSTGTGFLFQFYIDSTQKSIIPLLLTNWHVIDSSDSIRLYFRKAKGKSDEYDKAIAITIANNSESVLHHPDPNIDLVAISLTPILNDFTHKGINILNIFLDEKGIVSDSTMKAEMKSIEDVWMIGYPNGLWDVQNTLPIVRKGITATQPFVRLNGKDEFMVDIAAFGGSSGSPIFFYRDIFVDKTYTSRVNVKMYLLGILYAGPLYTVEGKIIRTLPVTIAEQKTTSSIPMNLGYVIKASEILKFKTFMLGHK